MKAKRVIHHWRWRSGELLITCGNKNGYINIDSQAEPVTCKACIRVAQSRARKSWPNWERVGQ